MYNKSNNNISDKEKHPPGLYIISTPIGNMKDITLRAISLITEVDFLYSEDPRQSLKLLSCFDMKRVLYTYNDQSGDKSRLKILDLIRQNHTVGLISDAGTPTISDPGYKLVTMLSENNIPIYSIPGACALIAALSCSAMPTDEFHFFGFPPRKSGDLELYLHNTKKSNGSLIFYESANRIKNFFEIAQKIFPNCCAFIAKELTKLHETIVQDKIENIYNLLLQKSQIRGEFVIIINNDIKQQDIMIEKDLSHIVEMGKKYLSVKDLSKFLSEISNLNKKEIYNLAIK